VGNTIVISKGLVDVLPDEASLAAVLSHELAHIVLGHNLGSKYAFNDRMLFDDDSTYQNLGFKHIPEEEAAADKKALELLKNSPYAQKLDNVGLFLTCVAAAGSATRRSVDHAPGQFPGGERNHHSFVGSGHAGSGSG
jgi:hypothetical protein